MNPRPHFNETKKHKRKARTQMLTVRRFQYQYAFFLVSFGAMISLVVGGITLYLLNHNYNLLIRAELINAPRTVDSLAYELRLANEVIAGAYIGFILFLGLVGIKFSHSIVMPIYLIQEKMRGVCRGDYHNALVRIRGSDEFQEFAETYNYMIESQKAQIVLDLKRISELQPDPKDRDSFHTWQKLIEEKKAQLSGPDFSSADQAPSSRLVS